MWKAVEGRRRPWRAVEGGRGWRAGRRARRHGLPAECGGRLRKGRGAPWKAVELVEVRVVEEEDERVAHASLCARS